MSYLLDTGFLYALHSVRQRGHAEVRQVVRQLQGATIFLPTPVAFEVIHLLRRDLGSTHMAAFIESLAEPIYTLVEPTAENYRRAAAVVRQYDDAREYDYTRIDFVDAILVSIAEELDIRCVLTLDRHHFTLFRPRHCDAFTLLP